jgi:hypothetical protein
MVVSKIYERDVGMVKGAYFVNVVVFLGNKRSAQ